MSERRIIGPWAVKSSTVADDNPWLQLEHSDVVRPDGGDGAYGVVRFKNIAIGILPLFDDGTVPLVGQHRFPLDAYSWELPEGGGALDTDPVESAKRELEEETGFSALSWSLLGEADLSNSVTDERCQMFLAWGLVPGKAHPEPTEVLSHDRVSFAQLVDRCLSGDIRDALTQMMTLTALAKFHRGALNDDAAERIARGLGRV